MKINKIQKERHYYSGNYSKCKVFKLALRLIKVIKISNQEVQQLTQLMQLANPFQLKINIKNFIRQEQQRKKNI